MTKKDVMELRKRLTKDGCTFTKMGCCYVNHKKEKVVTNTETFLNLEDEEFFKYLDIAKKAISGKVGNNLLELEFPFEEEQSNGKQTFLMGLKQSRLENDELLDRLYDLVIESYDFVGNYLILTYHDAYDVMTKTSDNRALDESEEVFEYLLVAICPVQLSKPGLGYLETENRIGPRIRDWIVSPPETGILFPAFTDRSSDIHSLIYYTKNAKETKARFVEEGLGCKRKHTSTEQKIAFKEILDSTFIEEDPEVIKQIHENLNQRILQQKEMQEDVQDKKEEPVVLSEQVFKEVLEESGVPVEIVPKMTAKYESCFKDEAPTVEDVIDMRTIKKIDEEKAKKHAEDVRTFDIVLQTKPEKAGEITTQVIDGRKCLVIPLDDNEMATINGKAMVEKEDTMDS